MGTFSIKDIEAVSGIKCHTLRIWENRYGILKPTRTDSNIRCYDDDDLKYILNVSTLNKHGFKISVIAKMDKEELCSHVLRINQRGQIHDHHIKNLIATMLVMDEFSFHHALTTSIIQFGFEQAMVDVVFPFLNEVGILWQIGSLKPMHEHFVTNIIKQKLYVAIDGNMGRLNNFSKRFLLFLPEKERHSLGLLFASFLLRARGHEIVYLGQDVPLEDILGNSNELKADYVFTILTSAHVNIDKQRMLRQLSVAWPEAEIIVTGIQFLNADFEFPERVSLIRNIGEFIGFADQLAKGITTRN